MDVAEIVKRLEAAGFGYSNHNGSIDAIGTHEQWSALFPTDEERLALLALRAGVTVCWERVEENYDELALLAPDDLPVADWRKAREAVEASGTDTPIAALAAAARVLGLGKVETR